MNGGTFTTGKEKERAGIYFNFKTTAQGGCRSVNGGQSHFRSHQAGAKRKRSSPFPALRISTKKWASVLMIHLYCFCVKQRRMRKRY